MSIPATIAGIQLFLEYFRSSKSPYLLVVVAATISLVLSCDSDIARDKKMVWYIAIPMYIILFIIRPCLFYDKSTKPLPLEDNDIEKQELMILKDNGKFVKQLACLVY